MMRHVALALVALAAAACGHGTSTEAPGRSAATAPALPSPGLVDPEATRRLAAAGVRIVDVRTAEEFAEGHVRGAILVPYDEIGRRAAELGPPSTPVVVYCRSGRRSAIAADALRALGYDRVYDAQRYDALAEAGL